MAKLMRLGANYVPLAAHSGLVDGLPPAVYILQKDDEGVFFFQGRDDFRKLPEIYGNHPRIARRVLETFERKDGHLGALFAGEKGSGKTMLGKLVAREAAEHGMATVLIETPWDPREISRLIAKLDSPTVFFIDEFDKIYSKDDGVKQEALLSLLDGTSESKHLFIFTVNDVNKVNGHMLNRPGRIHYRVDFEGIDRSFVREYCDRHLERPEELPAILLIAASFEKFNFDMLRTLVDEVNFYGESAVEAARILNMAPGPRRRNFRAIVEESPEGKSYRRVNSWSGDPVSDARIEFIPYDEASNYWDSPLFFERADAIHFDVLDDVYSFKKDGVLLTLRLEDSGAPHWLQSVQRSLDELQNGSGHTPAQKHPDDGPIPGWGDRF